MSQSNMQHSPLLSPFEQLGLPADFDLEIDQIETAYFKCQRDCHPDRLPIHARFAEKEAAVRQSAALNHAYQQIKTPLGRAQALLAEKGYPLPEAPQLPEEALMRIFSWQEQYQQGNHYTLIDEIGPYREQLIDRLRATFKDQEWATAQELTITLLYIEKLLLQCRQSL